MYRLILVLVIAAVQHTSAAKEIPPYIKQCRSADPDLTTCLKSSLHHLGPYLAIGIPEIEMPTVEPFRMDKLTLALTGGPQGYRVTLADMDIYGASNFTVKSIKLSENGEPFRARITMPRLRIAAHYMSSGVLIILPASGNGSFSATFDGVTVDLSGTVSSAQRDGERYLHVDTLNLDLKVRDVRMGVERVFKNNRILTEATNLFLRENGQEVLNAMQPQLRKKLSKEFVTIANQLLKHVPISSFLLSE